MMARPDWLQRRAWASGKRPPAVQENLTGHRALAPPPTVLREYLSNLAYLTIGLSSSEVRAGAIVSTGTLAFFYVGGDVIPQTLQALCGIVNVKRRAFDDP